MTAPRTVLRKVHIGAAWDGLTVFEAVRRAFPEVTPRQVTRKLRAGEIRLEDGRCRPDHRLKKGDTLLLDLPVADPRRPAPAQRRHEPVDTPAGPFWLVREDAELLALSKPAGCASHPALGHGGDTLVERVRAYLGTRPDTPFQPALANRLDIGTSGLVLVAKTRPAQRRLGRHLQQGRLEKRYLALVDGWPKPGAGEIRIPLVRRADSRQRSLPPDHPKRGSRLQDAVTRYRTVHRCAQPFRAALLELELVTGRTHQLRRHLARVGHPVAGDRRYGDPGFNVDVAEVCGLARPFLHAYRVRLDHPTSGEFLDLRAPLPPELAACLGAFGPDVVRAAKDVIAFHEGRTDDA